MFFKDFVSVKREKIKKGASQTYDTPSFHVIFSSLYYFSPSKGQQYIFAADD